MKRGEIYYATLDPTIGSEIAKLRPALIVSNDINNRVATTITILPITSNVTKVYPFEVALFPADSGLPKASKIQAQQIRTHIPQLRAEKKIVHLYYFFLRRFIVDFNNFIKNPV